MSNFFKLKNTKDFKKGFTPTLTLLFLYRVLNKILTNFVMSFKRISNYFLNPVYKRNITIKSVSGFTLVELLVTISLFVVITGVVLFNSKSFDNSVLLHNFTYDVALTIKQAQTYGVNVNENSQGSFDSDYGVYFDISESPTNFVIFNDFLDYKLPPSDPEYDPQFRTKTVDTCDIDSECIKKYSMNKGTHIKDICVSNDLLNLSYVCGVTKLSVTFSRPSLEANIYTFGDTVSKNKYAKINLVSGDGATSSVIVTSVGQIYVEN